MDARTETALTLTNRAALELLEDDDTRLIKLWLHGRPTNTAKAYRGDVDRFRVFVKGRPLRECRLQDLQAFADSLEGLAVTSRARILSSVRSLFAFGHRLGQLPFNTGAPLKSPTIKNRRLRYHLQPLTHRYCRRKSLKDWRWWLHSSGNRGY